MDLKDLTHEQLEKATALLKAIAHPLRLSIIKHIYEKEKLTVTELQNILKIEQPVLSHHLNILRDKGVLTSKRDGKNMYYQVKLENIIGILECISKCVCN